MYSIKRTRARHRGSFPAAEPVRGGEGVRLPGTRASRPQAGLWPAIWAKRAGVPQAIRSDRYRIVAKRAGRPRSQDIRHQGISSRTVEGSSSCCRRLHGAGTSPAEPEPGAGAWERGPPARRRSFGLLGTRASRPQAGLWPATWAKRVGVPQAIRSDRYRIVAMRAGRPRSQESGIREPGAGRWRALRPFVEDSTGQQPIRRTRNHAPAPGSAGARTRPARQTEGPGPGRFALRRPSPLLRGPGAGASFRARPGAGGSGWWRDGPDRSVPARPGAGLSSAARQAARAPSRGSA